MSNVDFCPIVSHLANNFEKTERGCLVSEVNMLATGKSLIYTVWQWKHTIDFTSGILCTDFLQVVARCVACHLTWLVRYIIIPHKTSSGNIWKKSISFWCAIFSKCIHHLIGILGLTFAWLTVSGQCITWRIMHNQRLFSLHLSVLN